MDAQRELAAADPARWRACARREPPACEAQEPARLTLRISADKARQLREVARERGVSVNSLLDEMASLAVFEFQLMRASRGE
ncbi:hypothetical protein [Azohydromonas aeria]|uniref:hypothetical protein n=1 Tax=Azohydromonas aeria TaxID=2590212 RepID=UPI0012FB79CC|nr:hypothetical protein [Azohydromonas aeria]